MSKPLSSELSDHITIGVDIIEFSRFHRPIFNRKSFLNLCFTPAEQQYCLSKSNPAQHFAARFAGKEAGIKALSGLNLYLERNKIEILNHENGRPYLTFHTDNPEILTLKSDISLSHSDTSAIAFDILYSEGK